MPGMIAELVQVGAMQAVGATHGRWIMCRLCRPLAISVGAGKPAKQAARWMAPAAPVFAGMPACMVRLEGVVGLNARF
ncbi:hypothetical protein PPUJ20005_49720 [Pseudomonas putida]|nr:hypothetical protein PPUJ20005_49720 [Pseudomonas putida]